MVAKLKVSNEAEKCYTSPQPFQYNGSNLSSMLQCHKSYFHIL
uniref:Uncharacterized protein n=1 Tax=Anguilla anguilla TaxID=7936 RepID=A0A0E9TJI0_ANGAN